MHCSQIRSLCDEAAILAIVEEKDNKHVQVEQYHFDAALLKVKPQSSEKHVEEYIKFKETNAFA